MQKKLKSYFESIGMKVDGNSAYGEVKGYEANAVFNPFEQMPLCMHFSYYATNEEKERIAKELSEVKFSSFRCEMTSCGIKMEINGFTCGSIVKKLPEIIDTVSGILLKNGAKGVGYCPICAEPVGESGGKKCNIEGFTVTLDEGCAQRAALQAEKRRTEFKEAPDNFMKGFLGALIGVAVGGILAIGIYFIGFISAWTAVLSVFLGAALYQKFGGKGNRKMIVTVSLMTLVCMIGVVFLVYVVTAHGIAIEAEVDVSAVKAFSLCMEDAEFSAAFVEDLIFMVIFTAIGVGLEIGYLYKKVKKQES